MESPTLGFVAFLVGAVVGAIGWGMARPRPAVGARLRETHAERLRRRSRIAMHRADFLAEQGFERAALYHARRAHRLDPRGPLPLVTLAWSLARRRHYEAAVKCYEAAYAACQSAPGHDRSTIAALAVDAAHCCARLRDEAHTELDIEQWTERILEWGRIAVEADDFAIDVLMSDLRLQDLGQQFQVLQMEGVQA